MRSCLFLGALAGAFLLHPTFSSAQTGVENPARGGARPAAAPVGETSALPQVIPSSGGKTVPRDSKLTAGDEITVNILEDHDPLLRTVVTDTGEVELNGLGRVFVAGRTSMEAQSIIEAYLKQRFYHRATVDVGITKKAAGAGGRPDKAVVAGKVGRPGPYYFTGANPLKLSEAVIVAGTSIYSDQTKVRLTRGGKSTEHDVNAIIKKGEVERDVVLKDGDQIFVPERGIIFGIQ